VYIFEGELSVYISGKEYRLKEGDAIFILPHQIHSYVTTQKSSYFLAIFSPSFVYDYYISIKGNTATYPVFRPCKQLITNLNGLNPKNLYQAKSYLYNLIHIFDQNTDYKKDSHVDEKFMKKTLKYIEHNFMHDISLDGLAKELGYDYNYTSNLFSKVFCRLFLSFVNDYRINYAKHLLVNTDDTITTIATACGYDSIRSFNRNFIKLANMTPSEYRIPPPA